MKIALIDNYDSFTYNLKALLDQQAELVDVYRNDNVDFKDLEKYDAFVFSPGPSTPEKAGKLLSIIDCFKLEKPMLGICLGMQAIAEVFGGKLTLLDRPHHGFALPVIHNDDEIFERVSNPFNAGRYHSWVVNIEHLPKTLKPIAHGKDSTLMAIRHLNLPIYGMQFHPESILTEEGDMCISNFLNLIPELK